MPYLKLEIAGACQKWGPDLRLGVAPGGLKMYHWISGEGFPISVIDLRRTV